MRNEILFRKFSLEDNATEKEPEITSGINVVKVAVSLNRAIKMAEYKYYKPGITIEGYVHRGYNVATAVAQLKDIAREEMQKLVDEEKDLYVNAQREQKLKNTLKHHKPESIEYQLAYKELYGEEPTGPESSPN